jgi:16S rRNA (guanine527-N7)-methyltransferase
VSPKGRSRTGASSFSPISEQAGSARSALVNAPADYPEAPPEAEAVFGDRLGVARRFAEVLATDALTRGLMGPREVPRLWDRHLLNCAVVTDLLPLGARVVDVGSGAGLPGVVLAIRRPDLRVDLVEPLQRRATFLAEVVHNLELSDTVRVVRGRAEDRAIVAEVGSAQWVTARAVAPLDRLVRWCLPLLQPGGRLLALKGSSATTELAEHRSVIHRLGGRDLEVVRCGADVLAEPTVVVVAHKSHERSQRKVKGPA